jgi:hypothetical protein
MCRLVDMYLRFGQTYGLYLQIQIIPHFRIFNVRRCCNIKTLPYDVKLHTVTSERIWKEVDVA